MVKKNHNINHNLLHNAQKKVAKYFNLKLNATNAEEKNRSRISKKSSDVSNNTFYENRGKIQRVFCSKYRKALDPKYNDVILDMSHIVQKVMMLYVDFMPLMELLLTMSSRNKELQQKLLLEYCIPAIAFVYAMYELLMRQYKLDYKEIYFNPKTTSVLDIYINELITTYSVSSQSALATEIGLRVNKISDIKLGRDIFPASIIEGKINDLDSFSQEGKFFSLIMANALQHLFIDLGKSIKDPDLLTTCKEAFNQQKRQILEQSSKSFSGYEHFPFIIKFYLALCPFPSKTEETTAPELTNALFKEFMEGISKKLIEYTVSPDLNYSYAALKNKSDLNNMLKELDQDNLNWIVKINILVGCLHVSSKLGEKSLYKKFEKLLRRDISEDLVNGEKLQQSIERNKALFLEDLLGPFLKSCQEI